MASKIPGADIGWAGNILKPLTGLHFPLNSAWIPSSLLSYPSSHYLPSHAGSFALESLLYSTSWKTTTQFHPNPLAITAKVIS